MKWAYCLLEVKIPTEMPSTIITKVVMLPNSPIHQYETLYAENGFNENQFKNKLYDILATLGEEGFELISINDAETKYYFKKQY